ncbi:MAG: amidohydrolase [Deltaproteobacteria bacterium]|nr:amidohydrolase [Deltaproteobacteria bacterium]
MVPVYDLIIKNGLILPLTPESEIINSGFVAVKDGAIAAVGPMTELPAGQNGIKVIDAGRQLVMPGLINGHIHSAMTMFRGLADDLPLMTWLNDYIFPTEAKHVNPEMVYWGAKLSCAEMLLSGTTTMADGYFLENDAVRAGQESGMRAVMGQGVVDFPAPGVPDPKDNIKAAEEFINRRLDVSPLITPSIFCHSPYTCSPDTLRQGKELARRQGVLFQVHVAETRAEIETVLAQHGLTPVRYLDSLGILDENTLAVHCIHVDDEEIDILARRRTGVCVCLESNMKLASGIVPLTKMLDKGVRVAMGTDGPASNNNLNMFGEMRSWALFFKVATLDPTTLPAGKVLRIATSQGADVLGLGSVTGKLSPGRRADLIIVDLDRPNMKPLYHPESHLVYATNGSEIRTVIVDGRLLVENDRFLAFDLEETMDRVREISGKIRES